MNQKRLKQILVASLFPLKHTKKIRRQIDGYPNPIPKPIASLVLY